MVLPFKCLFFQPWLIYSAKTHKVNNFDNVLSCSSLNSSINYTLFDLIIQLVLNITMSSFRTYKYHLNLMLLIIKKKTRCNSSYGTEAVFGCVFLNK